MNIQQEYHYALGIQFDSPAARDNYFSRAERDSAFVPTGAALSHAASVPLGIWGDDSALRRDCARILAIEVAQFAKERGITLTYPISPVDVMRCNTFEIGYASARQGADSLTQLTLVAIGVEGRLGRYEERAPLGVSVTPANAREVIFDELVAAKKLS